MLCVLFKNVFVFSRMGVHGKYWPETPPEGLIGVAFGGTLPECTADVYRLAVMIAIFTLLMQNRCLGRDICESSKCVTWRKGGVCWNYGTAGKVGAGGHCKTTFWVVRWIQIRHIIGA